MRVVEGKIETNWTQVAKSFDDMNLKDDLLRGIYGYGFVRPSKIQERGILPIIQGHDTIAQAQSGTGKTATFSIATLQSIDCKVAQTQALILSPTRELADQSQKVINALGNYLDVTTHLCVGGGSMRDGIRALRNGPQVVVGTPGRVMHMIELDALDLRQVRLFILDEADEMLSRGFKDQIQDIFQSLPTETVQVCLISATMPNEILEISRQFMRSPVRILVKKEQVTLEGIRQFYVDCGPDQLKMETLCDLYETMTITQCVIFCNLKRTVDWLTDQLNQRDFTVSSMHGAMSPAERKLVLREFRSGSSRVLIATDLLARGIDVQQVSLVINFNMPRNCENYIHRIGRSGRMGKKGLAINLLSQADVPALREIEAFYQTSVEPLPMDVRDLI
jgi:translation initiation factor 4A